MSIMTSCLRQGLRTCGADAGAGFGGRVCVGVSLDCPAPKKAAALVGVQNAVVGRPQTWLCCLTRFRCIYLCILTLARSRVDLTRGSTHRHPPPPRQPQAGPLQRARRI